MGLSTLLKVRCLVAFLFPFLLGAENPAPGKIADKVVTKSDPSEGYALYLPSSYTAGRAWPILYCFDPAARGRIPVELFRDAAEKYGWIVAGSNTSRNGPFDVSLTAADAMWRDTHERFRIDPVRVYTAGFSGGARVATAIAMSTGQVAGVIASSGGFPGGRIPETVGFAVFATGGTEDFNLDEARDIERALSERKGVVRLAIFDGPHDWAPQDTLGEGVAWLEFLAGRDRKTWKNSKTKQIEELEAGGRVVEVCREVAALARDLDDAMLSGRAAGCLKSKPVRDAVAHQAQWRSAEAQSTRDLESSDETLSNQTLASLRKMANRPMDDEERRMARRVLAGAFVLHFEAARDARARKDLGRAQSELERCVRLRPDNANVWYADAAVAAARGDRKRALRSLRSALDHGFTDAARLRDDEAFAKLHGSPEFDRLLAQCEGRP